MSRTLVVLCLICIVFSSGLFINIGYPWVDVRLWYFLTDGPSYGEQVGFSVLLQGDEPLRIRWYMMYPNGTWVEAVEAENQTYWYTYPILERGNYKVKVWAIDYMGLGDIDEATFAMRPPTAEITPQKSNVPAGSNITFTVQINDVVPPPYMIRWYRNDVELPSCENQSTVCLPFNAPGKEQVKVVATDFLSGVSSAAADVTVGDIGAVLKFTPSLVQLYTATTEIGDTILLNVTVENVKNLWVWQISVVWDKSLLEFHNASLPSDNVFSQAEALGKPLLVGGPVADPDFSFGYLGFGCVPLNVGPPWVFNGTGTVCQLEFKTLRKPSQGELSCSIDFAAMYAETFLLSEGPALENIFFSTQNATYSYIYGCHTEHHISEHTIEAYTNATMHQESVTPSNKGRSIEFDVYGTPGDAVCANVTIPKLLLRDFLAVYKNEQVIPDFCSSESEAATHVCFEFVLDKSVERMRIEAAWSICDIAVLGFEEERDFAGRGCPLTIDARVFNEGLFSENFNLVLFANGTLVNQTQVSLSGRENRVVGLAWNTSDLHTGDYSLSVLAVPSDLECDPDDNYLEGKQIVLTIAGDTVGSQTGAPDGKVTMIDISEICRKFGSCQGAAGWNANLDINDDGRIELRDIAIACVNFGKTQ